MDNIGPLYVVIVACRDSCPATIRYREVYDSYYINTAFAKAAEYRDPHHLVWVGTKYT